MSFFMVYDIINQQIKEQTFNSTNCSVSKMKLAYNNYLIVSHDEGREINIFDLSNDFKIFSTFCLPNNLVILT